MESNDSNNALGDISDSIKGSYYWSISTGQINFVFEFCHFSFRTVNLFVCVYLYNTINSLVTAA